MGSKYFDKSFMLILMLILYTSPEDYFNDTVSFIEHTSIFNTFFYLFEKLSKKLYWHLPLGIRR